MLNLLLLKFLYDFVQFSHITLHSIQFVFQIEYSRFQRLHFVLIFDNARICIKFIARRPFSFTFTCQNLFFVFQMSSASSRVQQTDGIQLPRISAIAATFRPQFEVHFRDIIAVDESALQFR